MSTQSGSVQSLKARLQPGMVITQSSFEYYAEMKVLNVTADGVRVEIFTITAASSNVVADAREGDEVLVPNNAPIIIKQEK